MHVRACERAWWEITPARNEKGKAGCKRVEGEHDSRVRNDGIRTDSLPVGVRANTWRCMSETPSTIGHVMRRM